MPRNLSKKLRKNLPKKKYGQKSKKSKKQKKKSKKNKLRWE